MMYAEFVKRGMDLLAAGTPVICFDLETTGFSSKNDRILSISAIKAVMRDGILEECDRLDLLIDPERPIPQHVSHINHIYAETVAGKPKEVDAALIVREFFGEKPFVCGYNSISFDQRFMNAMYERCFGKAFDPLFHIDVLRMARDTLELNGSSRLSDVAEYLGVAAGLEFHNSMDDVLATFRCFMLLKDRYRFPLQDVNEKNAVPEDESPSAYNIRQIKYWSGYAVTTGRIYFTCDPAVKNGYYDIYHKAWQLPDDVDREVFKASVFRKAGVSGEDELVSKAKHMRCIE